MNVCIFEDQQYKNFLPLAYLRPVFDLLCGPMSLRNNIEHILPKQKFTLLVRPELTDVVRDENPGVPVNTFPDDDCWFINGRVLAGAHLASLCKKPLKQSRVFLFENEMAALFLSQPDMKRYRDQISGALPDKAMFAGLSSEAIKCTMVHYPWDLVYSAADEIVNSFKTFQKKFKKGKTKIYKGVYLINKKNILIGSGSVIKPGVVIDAEKGPVIIGRNVTIMPNTVIEGPAFIGDHSVIKISAKIYHGTVIGNWCKVGGEVDMSVMLPYSNKQHDGFLGHSYIGSWVNLGADTNTSDLKNTYGNIKVQVEEESIDTGKQFIGLMMGDHSKTGINVMLDSGTNIGISCNVYGAGLPPKFLPSFSWGGDQKFVPYDLEKNIETAKRVMLRRGISMSSAYEQLMRRIFSVTELSRSKANIH